MHAIFGQENSLGKSDAHEKQFTVVMRGTSAVIFLPNEHLRANHFPSTIGPVDITCTSRWISKKANVTTPGHLWIEAKGSGSKLGDVLAPFANAGYGYPASNVLEC